MISEYNDPLFQTENIYLGIFTDSGCQFQISYSFKVDVPMRSFGSPSNRSRKKKMVKVEPIKRNPLDFLDEEENDQDQ